MLRNYLTTALRHLLKHRAYAALNVLGLAVGMACCLLILLDIRYELSFASRTCCDNSLL
jgi:putative ABC transport system permease protein|tara:strand:- start:1702 stop:1878 length:177 start_codon:yes stop_codon:yes gene_type:complete